MKNLEIFNEIRSNLSKTAERNKGLTIKGIDDIDGYNKMKEAKNELRRKEIDLEKLAKSERQQALKYQRGIIALEKDLKAITSPLIEEYKKQLEEIDEIKARENRKVLLPYRKKRLKQIGASLSDEDLLNINENDWAEFMNEKREEYLKIKEQEKLEKERKEQEAQKIKEAEERARENAIKEERERKQKEDNEKAQKILQEQADKKAKEEAKLKDERIQNWLKENNYNEEDYKLINEPNRLVLYKKVGELEIK